MNQFTRRFSINCFFKTVILIFLLLWGNVNAENPENYSSQKASFSVKFKDEVSSYRVMGIFVLPNEIINLAVIDSGKNHNYQIKLFDGKLIQTTKKKWQWRAPARKGLYPLVIIEEISSDSITLNIFVMVPFKDLQGEKLNGYQIGKYPTRPLKI